MTIQSQVELQTLIAPRGVGRPRAIDETGVRKLVELFKVGHTVATACRLSGVPRTTYYDELARNDEFSDRMQAAQDVLTYRATQIVTMSIGRGSLKTAMWVLDRKDRREFHAQRAAKYRNTKRVIITETRQNTRSVSIEVDQ